MKYVICALLLSACAAQETPDAHVGIDARTGRITPSVGTNIGGVRVGASPNGGYVGTNLGPIGVSVGL